MYLDELKEQIKVHFDELSLLDFMGIDMDQLVEILTREIDDQRERFEETFR